MEKNLEHSFIQEVKTSIDTLETGGIILYPTDTIWGIGCDATNPNAIARIYALKQREEKKSLIILVSDAEMIEKYVEQPSGQILQYLQQAQTPTTAIFQNACNLPQNLVNTDGSIAIRVCRDAFCNALIQQLQKPIVSTSANVSGEPYPKHYGEISDKIKSGADYIVQHRQNDFSPASPSNIIRLNHDDEIEFLR